MEFDPKAIRDAAKLIGVHPAKLKRTLDNIDWSKPKPKPGPKLPASRRGWVARTRTIILSVPPEYNAERLAEKLYSALASGHR